MNVIVTEKEPQEEPDENASGSAIEPSGENTSTEENNEDPGENISENVIPEEEENSDIVK